MLTVMIQENAGQKGANTASVLDSVAAVMKVLMYEMIADSSSHDGMSIQERGGAQKTLTHGIGPAAVRGRIPEGQIAHRTIEEAVATIKASTVHITLMQSVADKIYASFPEGSKQRTRADCSSRPHGQHDQLDKQKSPALDRASY